MNKAKNAKVVVRDNGFGWVMFTAYIGALVYFIQRADGFWEIVLSFLQAAVWPAYVLYALLKFFSV